MVRSMSKLIKFSSLLTRTVQVFGEDSPLSDPDGFVYPSLSADDAVRFSSHLSNQNFKLKDLMKELEPPQSYQQKTPTPEVFMHGMGDAYSPGMHQQKTPTPVVFMHGMGDAGSAPGMHGICNSVKKMYNTHVLCLDVADGMSSIFTRMDTQLEEFTKVVQADSKIKEAGGFFLVGISQGALLSRAFIERVNQPKVRRFVSWTGVQNGEATCPPAFTSLVCGVWRKFLDPYDTPLAFSDYWRDPNERTNYLSQSRFLADLNNEKRKDSTSKGTRIINKKYRDNMLGLEKYMTVEATKDTMIYPHIAETHGQYKWREHTDLHDNIDTEKLEETEEYLDDVLGLRSLNEAGKLTQLTYAGQHVAVPHKMMHEQIFKFLGD